ncbi:MAG TPA: alpha/beta hydrolase [Polyangia bacterium]|jgi:pimeloyl-ACP methyl ester carboxylesterase|nr:alpha/beta hydrolase [Polyangia bacterium]
MIPTTEERTLPINGIDMHVELMGAGEPMLLLHGFSGCAGDWRQVFDLDDLARRHRLIVPDARGHGGSTNPEGSFSHRQCARDLAALLDALGVAEARAIGMSLGGNTLLHLTTAADQRGRIQAMVLVSATMYYPPSARAVMRQVAPETQPASEWETMRARHRHGDDQIRALWRHARAFADDVDDMRFTPPALAAISAPTLIVYGDRDPLYPVEMAVELYRAIPRAALRVVPGGGHGPIFAGRERTQFVEEALAFLARQPAST